MYFLSDTYLNTTGLLERKSPGERQGSMEGMGRKISTKGTASVELIGVAEKATTAKAEAWEP
jgi:hypothetical protein